MSRLNISLPAPMRAFVEEQVRSGQFATPSEYVRHLIREEQAAQAPVPVSPELERLLLEGLDSGFVEATDEWWAQLKAGIEDKIKARHA